MYYELHALSPPIWPLDKPTKGHNSTGHDLHYFTHTVKYHKLSYMWHHTCGTGGLMIKTRAPNLELQSSSPTRAFFSFPLFNLSAL